MAVLAPPLWAGGFLEGRALVARCNMSSPVPTLTGLC